MRKNVLGQHAWNASLPDALSAVRECLLHLLQLPLVPARISCTVQLIFMDRV
jgi:hypothetical protein